LPEDEIGYLAIHIEKIQRTINKTYWQKRFQDVK
jgi:transcriptional antiterminator